MTVYSTETQLKDIAHYLTAYMKIPYFQDDAIPGQIMEKIISLVRNGEQLNTYDYVDVIMPGRKNDRPKKKKDGKKMRSEEQPDWRQQFGWSIKSTKEGTPLTWKRAKIKNSELLIKASNTAQGLHALGNAIIDFCNAHAAESIAKFQLDAIGYARLIMHPDGTVTYFEKELCTREYPSIFKRDDYVWSWSVPKETTKKEQLSALHGVNKNTEKKAFAWHGRGENQLHFSGEDEWWPTIAKPTAPEQINFSADGHAMAFKLPELKVDWDALVHFLNTSS